MKKSILIAIAVLFFLPITSYAEWPTGGWLGGDISISGTIQGDVEYNEYTADVTLTRKAHNASIVMMTVAGEVTMWDCEPDTAKTYVHLWARDAEKIEVVPGTGSGDNFVLKDGTALTAGNELDIPATAGNKVTLLCTEDDTWRVYSEDETSTDGGAAD